MKKVLILCLVSSCRLVAQNALWIDLTGEWRLAEKKDLPEFARVDFDDRNWKTTRLPQTERIPAGTIWLRRTVTLPDGTDYRRLAVTLGLGNDAYEVYANGVHVGDTGGLLSADAKVPKPRTFPFAMDVSRSDRKLVIAIRAVEFPIARPNTHRISPIGPFLVTYREHAPVDAGVSHINYYRVQRIPTLLIGSFLLAIGVLLTLAWTADRQRIETLWLALAIGLKGASDIVMWGRLSESSYPLRPVFAEKLESTVVSICLAIFGARAMKSAPRWTQWMFWIIGAVYPLSFVAANDSSDAVFYAVNQGICSLGALLAVTAWWRQRSLREGRTERLVLALTFLAAELMHANTFGSSLGLPRAWDIGAFQVPVITLTFLIVAVTITVQIVRGLAVDRRERQRLSAEMEAGRSLQQMLLPSVLPATAGFQVEAVYQPAREVGGDLHWTRTGEDGSLIVVVGDVSGKGLKAAMVVSVSVGILRTSKSNSPAAILVALNEGLVGHVGGGFMTCCCARFNVDGTVTIANAGHPPAYCEGREVLVEQTLPLGIFSDADYEETVAGPGRYAFVSDGVAEAADAKGELFGFERTREISMRPATEIAEAARAWGQNDDITVVTVRRKA